jgi:hypothetical protein
MVDARRLQACLPENTQLSLPRLPHVPENMHPVIVEIWRVCDGLIQFGDLDAHNLWELAGSAVGIGFGSCTGAALGAGMGSIAGAANGGALGMLFGPFGAWWGAAAGAAAGATAGATMLATTGAIRAARWAAAAGRRTSENNSRVIGTYNEILVTVPCCRLSRANRIEDYSFVLATYTDSPASMLGESLIGWGYRKSPAVGKRGKDGALEVIVGESPLPFRVITRQESVPCPASGLSLGDSQAVTALSRPILGILPPRRLMLSFLDRSFEHPAVRVNSAAVSIEGDDAFLPGLGRFESNIDAFERGNPWGSFLMTGLPVTLSYPREIDA